MRGCRGTERVGGGKDEKKHVSHDSGSQESIKIKRRKIKENKGNEEIKE